jgi:hypothetical protein
MALYIDSKKQLKKKTGLTIQEIQKIAGIWGDIRGGGGCIVNVLGTKNSCFYTYSYKIEEVNWSAWKDVKFEPVEVEVTLSNKEN